MSFKSIGTEFARIVEIATPVEVIHEALGFAKLQGNVPVQQACGRLLMEKFAGRSRNYDPRADRELIHAYLHP